MSAERTPAPTAVIGAGPYGLAVGAHLRDVGVETHVFGDVMAFWTDQMPRGMLLRSGPGASSIADPARELRLESYARAEDVGSSNPVTLDEFVAYGHWFQRHAVPEVDGRRVTRVERAGRGFELTLGDGEQIRFGRVVVAAGLAPFPRRPAPFGSLPPQLVSHSADHALLDSFAGRRVVVIGSGQSALESATLLHEAGASVEVVARAPAVVWLGAASGRRQLVPIPLPPTDVGGRVTGWIAAVPDAFRRMPRSLQPTISYRCIRPAGAPWLRDRIADVTLTIGRRVVAAAPADTGLRLELDDGSKREADHVLLATGFDVDVRRYDFLAGELLEQVALDGGYPKLRRGLESSVPGLHFVGASAAASFGPVMRFVVGTWYSAPAVAARAAGRRQGMLRRSF